MSTHITQTGVCRAVDAQTCWAFSSASEAMFCSHLHGEKVLLELLDLGHVVSGETQAQTQSDEARHAESNAAQNFALLRQSLGPVGAGQQGSRQGGGGQDEVRHILGSKKSGDLAEAEKSLIAVQESEAANKGSCAQWPRISNIREGIRTS